MKTARHEELIQLLEQYENLTTQQLARLLEVSLETVRRDLDHLQKQGKIIRQHGRARHITPVTAAILLSNVRKAISTVKLPLLVGR